MGWGRSKSAVSTGVILLGTYQGQIIETCITATDEYFKKEDKFTKQVFALGEDGTTPILGLSFAPFISGSDKTKYSVFLITVNDLVQMIGHIAFFGESSLFTFAPLFQHYETHPCNTFFV